MLRRGYMWISDVILVIIFRTITINIYYKLNIKMFNLYYKLNSINLWHFIVFITWFLIQKAFMLEEYFLSRNKTGNEFDSIKNCMWNFY